MEASGQRIIASFSTGNISAFWLSTAPRFSLWRTSKGYSHQRFAVTASFIQMMQDLKIPLRLGAPREPSRGNRYHILSLVNPPSEYDADGFPVFDPRDFVIRCEDYGVPQTRHRVILLAIPRGPDG